MKPRTSFTFHANANGAHIGGTLRALSSLITNAAQQHGTRRVGGADFGDVAQSQIPHGSADGRNVLAGQRPAQVSVHEQRPPEQRLSLREWDRRRGQRSQEAGPGGEAGQHQQLLPPDQQSAGGAGQEEEGKEEPEPGQIDVFDSKFPTFKKYQTYNALDKCYI